MPITFKFPGQSPSKEELLNNRKKLAEKKAAKRGTMTTPEVVIEGNVPKKADFGTLGKERQVPGPQADKLPPLEFQRPLPPDTVQGMEGQLQGIRNAPVAANALNDRQGEADLLDALQALWGKR